jgi:predicted nucleic acid-binding protein
MRASRAVCIDASALIDLLLNLPRAAAVAQVLGGMDLVVAPDLINAEVLRTVRARERAGAISPERAGEAIASLADSPLHRLPTTGVIQAAWALRDNVTPTDACYVATARSLGVPLLTADVHLARAPGLGVPVIAV